MRFACQPYLFMLLLSACFISVKTDAQQVAYTKVLFSNSPMPRSFYYSEATYRLPAWIQNSQHKVPVSDSIYFTPGNALELNYISASKGDWQAKILNHDIRGVDSFLSATHLVFRLYIASDTKPEELPSIAIEMKDSQFVKALPLQPYIQHFRKDQWLAVRIPLAAFHAAVTPYNINAVVFAQQATDGKEHKLYIDQLELNKADVATITSTAVLQFAKGFEKHVDITWKPVKDTAVRYIKVYRSGDNKTFYPVGIQSPWINRYADFTDTTGKTFYYKISLLDNEYTETHLSNVLQANTYTMTESQLLDMVQEANFRYYWEGAESNSGLALEDIPGRRHMVAAGASGFGIMALIAGAERHFITHQQLMQRFNRITSFLLTAETFHGAYSHFIDGSTGRVIPFFGANDDGGDLVETAFLMQGVLTARQYFNGTSKEEQLIRTRVDSIWRRVEWIWYRKDADSKFLYWHWSPDKAWVINHRLIGWNETMITYILGIASRTHGIPASLYYSGWASQSDYAKEYRSWGQSPDGLHFTNGNTYYGIPLAVGVSNGGPLFFTHYSFLGLDPHQMHDAYTNYFTNNQNIAFINYRYCIENPAKHAGYGADAWGLTASDGPRDYSADEPVSHADHGKITPTGALASFPYTPQQSMAALKNYYRRYGKFLWGEYGFRDSFSPDDNWCSDVYMGLNQAPITVMIENYRSGLLWKLFMSSPEVKQGLKKLSEEKPAGK